MILKKTHLIAPLMLGAACLGSVSHAKPNPQLLDKDGLNPIATYVAALSMGPTWLTGGHRQTLALAPDVIKLYTNSNNDSAFFSGELFLGMQRLFSMFNTSTIAQLGLALATTSSAKVGGNVWEDADPNFNDFTYRYKIRHSRVALKGKLLFDPSTLDNYGLQPYVGASLGVGFNRAHDFSLSSISCGQVAAPPFGDHSRTAFSYTVVAGVQKAITNNWAVGVGYEFADWGKANLGRIPGQQTGTGLSLNRLYAQQLQFTLSYQG